MTPLLPLNYIWFPRKINKVECLLNKPHMLTKIVGSLILFLLNLMEMWKLKTSVFFTGDILDMNGTNGYNPQSSPDDLTDTSRTSPSHLHLNSKSGHSKNDSISPSELGGRQQQSLRVHIPSSPHNMTSSVNSVRSSSTSISTPVVSLSAVPSTTMPGLNNTYHHHPSTLPSSYHS